MDILTKPEAMKDESLATLAPPTKKISPPHDIPYISGAEEISNDRYHNSPEYQDFISSTSLKHYMISPKYAKWARENKQIKETEALRRGSVYHVLLASLTNSGDFSGFDRNWVLFEAPINEKTGQPYGATTKAFTEAHNEAKAAAGGRDLCAQHELDEAKAMITELLTGNAHISPDIKLFLKNGVGFCQAINSAT